jgi:hypothetical protein
MAREILKRLTAGVVVFEFTGHGSVYVLNSISQGLAVLLWNLEKQSHQLPFGTRYVQRLPKNRIEDLPKYNL